MGGATSIFSKKKDKDRVENKKDSVDHIRADGPASPAKAAEPEKPKSKAAEPAKKLSSFFSEKQVQLVFNTSLKVSPSDLEVEENGQSKVKIIPLTEDNLKKLDDWNLSHAEDIELYRWKRCMTLDYLPENQEELNAFYYRRVENEHAHALKKRTQSDFALIDVSRRVSTVANQSIANLNDVNPSPAGNPHGRTIPNLATIEDPEGPENEDTPEMHIHS